MKQCAMDRHRVEYLFYRFIEGRCSEAEQTEFLDLLEDPVAAARIKDMLDAVWANSEQRNLSSDQAESILATILDSTPKEVVQNKSSRRVLWWSAAAAVALAMLASTWTLPRFSTKESVAPGPPAAASPPSQYLKLPDGSTVFLNAGSSLDYCDDPKSGTREVTLKGEAYFDIVHDPARPFIVLTGTVRTTVLGTAFNIRAYPDQEDITVTVTRGQVKISDHDKVIGILNPDQQITLNREKHVAAQVKVDARVVASWIEKDIFFDDLTMEEVTEQLEKRFDVTITMTDSAIRKCRLTATFVGGEDVEQVLRIISEFNGATVVKETPGAYVIKGGGNNCM